MKHCKRILLKIGLCSNFKQNHGLKTKFFSKKQNPGVFLCVSVSKTRKKGLLLMKKATKKGIKTLKSESVNINKNK
jgi:hypothetical protein